MYAAWSNLFLTICQSFFPDSYLPSQDRFPHKPERSDHPVAFPDHLHEHGITVLWRYGHILFLFQGDGTGRTGIHAYPATNAAIREHFRMAVDLDQCFHLAALHAGSAGGAACSIHPGEEIGVEEFGRSFKLFGGGQHSAAAPAAAAYKARIL